MRSSSIQEGKNMQIRVPGNVICPVTGRMQSYGHQACADCPYLEDGVCVYGIRAMDFVSPDEDSR
jgi:hypothetical protein